MPILLDYILARGGTVTTNKPQLIVTVKQYQFLEKEVRKSYVNRNPNPNGRFYTNIKTSSTRNVGSILIELKTKLAACSDASDDSAFIGAVHNLFDEGLFDDQYDNISLVAP